MRESGGARGSIGRREFLISAALGSGGLLLTKLDWAFAATEGHQPSWNPSKYSYTSWQSVYDEEWHFDAAGRSTHSVNCTGSCSWKVLVKDDVVWRWEQAADYPAIGPSVPDYNPRGCQKGACAADYQRGAQRLKYPLKRVGARGEGKWQRVSWEQALTEIADRVLDTLQHHGPEYIVGFTPIPAMSPVAFASGTRLLNLLGGVGMTFYDWYCDLPPGEPITWGVQTDAAESADWTHSRYVIAWGSNVDVTRIPDAQMLQKARLRNGAKVVVIGTEYNPTAVHADQFVPVAPGTDLALALAMSQVILAERLYDRPYVKEQTDLPFLLRRDDHRFLRESDVRQGGSDERFYVWDAEHGLSLAPKDTLKLGGLDPELTGTWQVSTVHGPVSVTTVFEELRRELSDRTPEWAEKVSGVGADVIRRLARELAGTKPAMIIHGNGVNQWYHNDLSNRAMILLTALTGNVGRSGGGFNHYVGQEKIWTVEGWKALALPEPGRGQNTTIWTYWHAEMWRDDPLWAELQPFLRESVDKGWMPLWPKKFEDSPRVMFIWRANWLSQAKGNRRVIDRLLPKLDLIVNSDFRMSSTGLYADYVLPAASWEEMLDLSMTDLTSFIHPFTPVVRPLAEAKTDWQTFRLLAQHIERRARERSFTSYTDEVDGKKLERDLTTLASRFTMNGALDGDRAAAQFILSESVESKGYTVDDLIRQPRRFKATSEHWTSPIVEGKTYTAFQRHVDEKKPWSTLTGRQQFYVDHPWYLKLGVALPTYKPPLHLGSYPLRYATAHYRHSIHSSWFADLTMQRLAWGEPFVYVSPVDAAKRGIEQHDWVRVYNDFGSVKVRARIHPALTPGQVILPQGGEIVQFAGRANFQTPLLVQINPTQLVQYGHLKFSPNYWGPTASTRDALVEIVKA